MAHPKGGSGTDFPTKHTFAQAYELVGSDGYEFQSTTGETMNATQGLARDKKTKTIVFAGTPHRQNSIPATF